MSLNPNEVLEALANPQEPTHFVSASCDGECCGMCLRRTGLRVPAAHKVGEETPHDAPREMLVAHNLTQYVCCGCFREILGPGVRFRLCPSG